jgi:lambda family phage minor tail protein L
MTDIIDTVQTTELDDAYVELFDITLNYPGGSTIIHLVDGLDADQNNLYFPYPAGGDNRTFEQYLATPIGLEGFSISSSGAQNRPNLTVANVASLARSITDNSNTDSTENETNIDTILSGLNITKNEDILGSLVTHRRTLLKNTFVKLSGSMYLYGDRSTVVASPPVPKEFPTAKYVLDRVAAENHLIVQFELSSPFDVQGLKIPNRYVIGKYCPWEYRGAAGGLNTSVKSGCTYNGNSYFDIDGNSVPTLAADACGKTIEACKLRFHPIVSGEHTEIDVPLPFGGFPGSRKFK